MKKIFSLILIFCSKRKEFRFYPGFVQRVVALGELFVPVEGMDKVVALDRIEGLYIEQGFDKAVGVQYKGIVG